MFLFRRHQANKRDESLVNYIVRKHVLFRGFEKHMTLPKDLKACVLLRESKLNDAGWDTVEHWTKGSDDIDLVGEKLRELERPLPSGSGGHRIHGM
eukprot:9343336-Pyramimonas_sp.AAC.1